MSHYKYRMLSLTLAASLLWLAPLVSAEKASDPIISAKFKCLSVGAPMPEGIDILIGPKKRLHLNIPATYIESAIKYNGPGNITFVKPEEKPVTNKSVSGAPDPSPSSPPEILASVEIAPPGGDYLLLFAGSAGTKLRVLAVPFSSDDVPPGSCLVWNVTPRVLGVSLGGQRELMQPQKEQLFKPTMMVKDYIDLRVFDEYQGKPRLLVGGPHFLPDQTRQLLFITERVPGGTAVQVKVVSELPEPAPGVSRTGALPRSGGVAAVR